MKKKLAITLDEIVLDHIDETSKKLRMSRSAYINAAFIQGMNFQKKMEEFQEETEKLIPKGQKNEK